MVSMLLGVEEAKERGDYQKIVEKIGCKGEPTQEVIVDFCNQIATKIESGIFTKFDC